MIEKSRMAYQDALDRAQSKMDPTHPIRLGLVLNYSVFYYEIINSPEEACKMAKSVSDDNLSYIASYMYVLAMHPPSVRYPIMHRRMLCIAALAIFSILVF